MSLQAIAIPPATGKPPTGIIVALHGWGANAQDVAALMPLLNLPDYQFMIPNGPFAHPYNAVGKMWYNLQNYDFQRQEGLPESRQALTEWLKSLEDVTGVPLSRTILSGFSQGGAMTLDVGLGLPLAGLVVLSGYLHAEVQPSETFPPVLVAHGRQDTVVPLSAAHTIRSTLSSLGVAVEYHEFDMGHEVRPVVLEFMRKFILETLPPS